MMDKPPPSYEETFPYGPSPPNTKATKPETNNVQNTVELERAQSSYLESVKKADIIPVPVMRQLLSEAEEESRSSTTPNKKYLISDHENGNELFYGVEMRSASPDLRGLSLRSNANGVELLKCGYLYSLNFSQLEFSSPNGSPIGTFKRESFGLGLCGWFCLCFCFPMATASLKATNGEPLFVCDAYLFPRKVDVSRAEHLGGGKIGSIDVQEMNAESIVKVSFEDAASVSDKILILGLGMSMMDYERVRQARGGNPYTLNVD